MGGRNAYGTRRKNRGDNRERKRIKNKKVLNTRKKFDETNVLKTSTKRKVQQ